MARVCLTYFKQGSEYRGGGSFRGLSSSVKNIEVNTEMHLTDLGNKRSARNQFAVNCLSKHRSTGIRIIKNSWI